MEVVLQIQGKVLPPMVHSEITAQTRAYQRVQRKFNITFHLPIFYMAIKEVGEEWGVSGKYGL